MENGEVQKWVEPQIGDVFQYHESSLIENDTMSSSIEKK